MPDSRHKPRGRSRATNDSSKFIVPIDGRTVAARRYRDVTSQIVQDIGGDPSEAEAAITRRAGTLIVWCEEAEAAMARGEKFDIGAYTTATNALRRLLSDIGLRRRPRVINTEPQTVDELIVKVNAELTVDGEPVGDVEERP
jgi:hypothetical protein